MCVKNCSPKEEIELKCYIADAFTEQVFKGNPAAVCILDKWPEDTLMQNIAMENNLSETAFIVGKNNRFQLRWFTPGGEIDLCGHATLAAAYILFRFVVPEWREVAFETMSGLLTVRRDGELYEMELPTYTLQQVPVTDSMEHAIGARPVQAWMGRDLVCVMENAQAVIHASPDMEKVEKLDGSMLHLTAKGNEYDCVTRSFGPKFKVPEDPVCGSGHCHVVPIWAEKLQKDILLAYQASRRTGVLRCKMDGTRVKIAGKAVLYSIAELFLPE